MRLPILIVLLGLAPLLNACATATRGTTTNLLVVTDPVGAKVESMGRKPGQCTPSLAKTRQYLPGLDQFLLVV